jgi:hypothetical protein
MHGKLHNTKHSKKTSGTRVRVTNLKDELPCLPLVSLFAKNNAKFYSKRASEL